jgi:hypothetical protein
MKKKIIIGLALTASLLYFEISCGKKENSGTINDSLKLTPPKAPMEAAPLPAEAKLKSDFVSPEHYKYYKEQLLNTFHLIVNIDFHFKLSFINNIINGFSAEDKNLYTNKLSEKIKSFETSRAQAFSPESTLYLLLITPNPKITYRELYFYLSKITNDINNLKTKLSQLTSSSIILSSSAANILTKGTSTDDTKGFIGYDAIARIYGKIKFIKKSKNDAIITHDEWKNEEKEGYSPDLNVAVVKIAPNQVTLEHSKQYKAQLLNLYHTMVETDYHIKLSFIDDIVDKFSTDDKIAYANDLIMTELQNFETSRVRVFNPQSSLYQLIINPNPEQTYRELYFRLSQISYDINTLKTSLTQLTKVLRSQLTATAANSLIKSVNTDKTKGFVGYDSIYRLYDGVRFTKKSMNNAFINPNDWKKEQESGYSPN